MNDSKLLHAIEALKDKKQELEKEIAYLDKLINSYKNQLKNEAANITNNSSSQSSATSYGNYDPNSSVIDKVYCILENEKRFLHNREIVEIIKKHEPKIDVNKLSRRVSSILAKLKRDDVITNIKVGSANRNYFWGSSKWLNENGKPKQEHMYNNKYLVVNTRKRKEL